MPDDRTIAIIGLGLIGGSLARDLAALGARVLGFDSDSETLAAAVAAGVVHRAISASLEKVAEADVIVLAVPVTATPTVLRTLAAHARAETPITDVGSTKAGTLAAAAAAGLGAQFVGSHPLAGDHRQGWTASRESLFAEAAVYVCPGPEARPAAVTAVTALWRMVGARPLLVTAAEHDQLVAWTSHLPQTAAFALAAALAREHISREALGPGGTDTLRLAASPPELWAGIALDNSSSLREAIGALRRTLLELEQALQERDGIRIQRMFRAARAWYTGAD